MLHALIMAGGSGTRFWPASRNVSPKQLLSLAGSQSMLQATVERLGSLMPAERVLVLTNQRLVEPIRQQLPQLPASSVIGEPCRRDTAPAIGLAAVLIAHRDPDATMVAMPADHVIGPVDVFQQAILQAAALVDADPSQIVTFGIRPTYPAESFGYIERGEPVAERPGRPGVPGEVLSGKTNGQPSRSNMWRPVRFTGTPGSSSGKPRPSWMPCDAFAGDTCPADYHRPVTVHQRVLPHTRARIHRHRREVDRLRRDGTLRKYCGHRGSVHMG